MNENLKTVLEEAGKNEELKAKLENLTDKDMAELSLDELDQVAGGGLLDQLKEIGERVAEGASSTM